MTIFLEDLDTGGVEPKKAQLRIEDDRLIIRIGGARGEELSIKTKYIMEALNEHKATLV